MSDPSHVSSLGLNQCGCCAGVTSETPADVLNRPGLSAIAYRVGTQSRIQSQSCWRRCPMPHGPRC